MDYPYYDKDGTYHSGTLASLIEEVAGGGDIIACVIGRAWSRRDDRIPDDMFCRILDWETARPLVDYNFSQDFGGADCHPIYAWTENRVILVHEYDGSKRLVWVPRSPVDIEPKYCGQE